ncbi:amidohydrolase family protein [Actinomycetaceae bacterium L2_0104]
MTSYHVTGALRGTDLTELWVVDGRISYQDPVRGARLDSAREAGYARTGEVDDDVVELSGWIYPGLLDAHTHPGLSHSAEEVGDAEVLRRLEACRAQGVTHIREMGAQRDVAPLLRNGLPKVIRAGRHIARPMRYLRHLAVEIEPRDLPAESLRQLARSDGWIKLVGDWIDRSEGTQADLRPLWPREILIDAVAAVHDAGGKVAVHTFATETVDDLLAAGVDSIEHGSGMTRDQLVQARDQGVLIDPTVRQMATFPEIASHASKYPVYRDHMLAMDSQRPEHIRLMTELGSHFLMGSDTGGDVAEHGMIAELARAVADGMPASVAMSAASYEGRRRLELPTWEEGAPADFVIYDADPERDISVTAQPAAVLIDGILTPG